MSPLVTWIYFPFGLVGPVVLDPARLGGDLGLWFTIGVAGQIGVMLTFAIGLRLLKRLRPTKVGPIITISVIIAGVMVRALLITQMVDWWTLSATAELGYRIQSGLIGQTTALLILSLAVSAYSYHKNIATTLAHQRLELETLTDSMSERLEAMKVSIRSEVHKSVDPLVQQLDDMLRELSSNSQAEKVCESLRQIVENELRPLSHRLSSATESVASSVTTAQLSEGVKLPRSSRVRVSLLLRPILIGALVVVLAVSQSAQQFDFPRSLLFPVLSGVLVFLVLSFFRLALKAWTPPLWIGVITATILVPIATVVTYFVERAVGIAIPISLGVAAAIVFAVLGLATSLYFVVTEHRVSSEHQLKQSMIVRQTRLSALRQQEYVVRNHLSYIIHGSIQSALYSASMRLAAIKHPTPESVAEIRADINRAVMLIDSEQSRYELVIDTLSDIAEVWDGTCNVHWSLDHKTVVVLVHAPEAATSVAEIAKEAVGNAIRHGLATDVRISISSSDGLVALHVSDNGVGIEPEWQAGLGTRMLNEVCLEWSRVSDESGTHLHTLLATR
ncbi:MAG: hypothetical protein K9G05_05435 [Candidatus Nanopelagicales bacterium]|nr:hypothetical protein [Candidatus Nanopelagicales bacterium]